MLENCRKVTIFPIFGKKSFLNRTLGVRKSFLNQTTYVPKKSVVATIFLKSRFFFKSGFLKSRAYCNMNSEIWEKVVLEKKSNGLNLSKHLWILWLHNWNQAVFFQVIQNFHFWLLQFEMDHCFDEISKHNRKTHQILDVPNVFYLFCHLNQIFHNLSYIRYLQYYIF